MIKKVMFSVVCVGMLFTSSAHAALVSTAAKAPIEVAQGLHQEVAQTVCRRSHYRKCRIRYVLRNTRYGRAYFPVRVCWRR